MPTESLSDGKPLSVFSEHFLRSFTFQSLSVIISKILKFTWYSFVQENLKENFSIFWIVGVYILDIYHSCIRCLCAWDFLVFFIFNSISSHPLLLCVGVWVDTCTFTPIHFPQQHEADTGILFKNLYFPQNLEGTPCSIITHSSTKSF